MKLAVVAGEASGDLHASEVVRELKKRVPDLVTFGIGGDLLASEGMELLHHAREMGIVGLFNVLRHLGMFRRTFAEMVDRIAKERPDAVMLVDYPGFNLRLAKKCKEMGIKVVYYISPQIWAWRQGRVKQIARTVDEMIVIFPFEADFYRKHGVHATYVGNPLVEQLGQVVWDGQSCLSSAPQLLRIALMPGSRRHEVKALLPPMVDAVKILRRERAVDAYIIQAPTISEEELRRVIQSRADGEGSRGTTTTSPAPRDPSQARDDTFIRIIPHDRGQSLADADISLSSSGTAVLEAAVVGTPVVVMYHLSRLTYWIAQRLVKVPHFSLPNIIAGKQVLPELLQSDVNGERIAAEVRRIVEPGYYARVKEELAAVRAKLGEPGAAGRAADAILEVIRG